MELVCPKCGKTTEFVVGHAVRDMMCSECGSVLEADAIDESSRTIISKPNDAQRDSMSSQGRRRNRGSNRDRSLMLALQTIATIADSLGLVSATKDRANEIYKKVESLKSMRGRRSKDAILAACVYFACIQEKEPRTVKEISAVVIGVHIRAIGKAIKFVEDQLRAGMGASMDMGRIHIGNFLRRFCSILGVGNNAVRAAVEVVTKSNELNLRRDGLSVAAASIYMVSHLSDSEEKKTPKDISPVVSVSVATIRNTYKELHPHAAQLIPEWFLNATDIKNLPAP